MTSLHFDSSTGSLELTTGVTGRAARMGHRLTIRMKEWTGDVNFRSGRPVSATLTVPVAGFDVIKGEGGIKGLSGPERAIVRANALGSLDATKYPTIEFAADDIQPSDEGFVLHGTVTIHGATRPIDVTVTVATQPTGYELATHLVIRQSDFGISPYSLMAGALAVADDVDLRWHVTVPPPG